MPAPSTHRFRPTARDPLLWRIASLLRHLEQPFLGVAAVTAFVLGFVGYRSYFHGQGEPTGLVDTLYADLELFKLSSRVEGGTVPWTLDTARLLAPAVSGYAAFRGVIALYRGGFDRLRARVARGHVVVVGGGEPALAVARTLARRGRKVVLADDAPTPDRAALLRSQGVIAIAAGAGLSELLSAAGAPRAREVVSLTDDDARNVDLTLRVRELSTRRAGTRGLGSVRDPALCELLRVEAIDGQRAPLTDFLNGAELTARSVEELLRAHGLDGDLLLSAPRDEALQLCARLARSGFTGSVHLRGPDVEAIAEGLDERFGTDPSAFRRRRCDGSDVDPGVRCAVIVGADSTSVAEAVQTAHRLPPGSLVIAVLPDCAHLRALVDSEESEADGVPILLVDSLAWWSDADLVLGGSVEVLARATHDNYRRERLASAAAAIPLPEKEDPALVPWDRLAEHLKESNRDQARHVWTKLRAVGCALTLDGGRRVPFAFEPDEVEILARLEHDRWVAERVAAGWRAGPRDPATKHTPYLVGWADLSEEIRDLDRIAVLGIPAFVADLGYRVVRVRPRPHPAAGTSSAHVPAPLP